MSTNKWIDFYQPFFTSDEGLTNFISDCEEQVPPNNLAKIMMHQTQRLISLADDVQKIRCGKESLQVLFLIICVENIAKLHASFTGYGESRRYTKNFFNEFLSDKDKKILEKGFIDGNDHLLRPLNLDKTVNILYDIRCDVVHEGKYWNFAFHNGETEMINTDPDVNVNLTFQEVRDIVVRGCIYSINDKLSNT